MKKVGIVGSRQYTNKLKVKEFIYKLKEKFEDNVEIVSGGCKYGADKYAKKYGLWLKKKRIPHKNPHFTRIAAEKREEEVAKILKKRYWAVWWN